MIETEFLHTIPLFEHLKQQDLEQIASMLTTRHYDKGNNLFFEQEEGHELYIVRSGSVKIYRQEEGKEIILAIIREGEFFGEMALIGDGKTRSASANTLEKSVIYTLSRSHFLQLLTKSPDIFLIILHTTLERLRRANELLADLAMTSTTARVARLLLRLMEEDKGEQRLNMKLTHNQIADMVAASRETVTKTLSDLQQTGLIEIINRQIVVRDIDGLRAAAELV